MCLHRALWAYEVSFLCLSFSFAFLRCTADAQGDGSCPWKELCSVETGPTEQRTCTALCTSLEDLKAKSMMSMGSVITNGTTSKVWATLVRQARHHILSSSSVTFAMKTRSKKMQNEMITAIAKNMKRSWRRQHSQLCLALRVGCLYDEITVVQLPEDHAR